MSFGARLAAHVDDRRSQIVLGLDPDPARLWPAAQAPPQGDPATRAAKAVEHHCALVIEATAQACVATKLQLACFERLGAPGWAALHATAVRARDHGLLVIADGKRGDIDVSAAAYGQALFGPTPTPFGDVEGLRADAATANPLLGNDALAPLVDAARSNEAGIFVLVRTSNPGAADVQDLEVEGAPVWERLAGLAAGLAVGGHGADGDGDAIADVGAVVGATAPHVLARARELMPRAPFLLPGVGAQGGRVEDLAPAFAPGRAGGLITASRSIVHAGTGDADPAAAARAEAERLRELAWSLA